MPGFGQPQGQAAPPQQQFRGPQEQTLQAGVRAGGQQGKPGAYFSPAPPQQGGQGGQPGQGGDYQPHVPEFKVAGVGGGPYTDVRAAHRSRFNVAQLRQSDGIIPLQYGTNRFASQKGMTGFGSPRDVNGKHLHRVWDDIYTEQEGYQPGDVGFEGQGFQGQGQPGQQQQYQQYQQYQ